jgi:NitT/TauT family transport system permease protein
VRLPNAGPHLAAGIRTGATLSLVGAVVAEWTGAGQGLGYIVLSANSRLATAQAFAAVLLICLLGLVAYGCVGLVERRIGWWMAANLNKTRML